MHQQDHAEVRLRAPEFISQRRPRHAHGAVGQAQTDKACEADRQHGERSRSDPLARDDVALSLLSIGDVHG